MKNFSVSQVLILVHTAIRVNVTNFIVARQEIQKHTDPLVKESLVKIVYGI